MLAQQFQGYCLCNSHMRSLMVTGWWQLPMSHRRQEENRSHWDLFPFRKRETPLFRNVPLSPKRIRTMPQWLELGHVLYPSCKGGWEVRIQDI